MNSFFFSFFDKLNLNSKSNLVCSSIKGGLLFTHDGKISLCKRCLPEFSIVDNFNGLGLDVDLLKSRIKEHSSASISNNCINCPYIVDDYSKKVSSLDFVVLSHWKCCFLDCVYCQDKKTDDLLTVNHFDIMPVIEQLIDSGLISKETQIIFDCGDATLHPEFDKLMYFFINYGMKNIIVKTSALRFCQSVADAISRNILQLVISIDAGCPYIYEKVKGLNKFDLMISNLKRYLEYEDKSRKHIALSYNLVEGINDNKKELIDWFMFSRNLGVKKLILDIDDKWYNNVCANIPNNLKELILFVKELSELNKFEIEFSQKIDYLYKIAKGN